MHCIRLLSFLVALSISAQAADAPTGKVQIEARKLIGGDSADGDVLRAEGDVRACFGGYTLQTEILEYSRREDLLHSPTAFELRSPSHRLRGAAFSYRPQMQSGEAEKFNLVIGEDGLYAAGEKLQLRQRDYTATTVALSSCKPDSRDWFLQAEHIVRRQKTVTARNVWFRVRDIPVLYMPMINIYTGDEKRSGFLRPEGEYSGSEGVKVALPYYVFWRQNADVTFTPQWFSKHGFLLGGDMRYLLPKHRGTAAISWTPFVSGQRGRQSFEHVWSDSRWQWTAAADNVSDDAYFTDFSSDADLLARRNLSRRVGVEYNGDNWRGRLAAESFKTLNYSGAPPHDVLPQAQVEYDDGRGDYSWTSQWEYSRFVANRADQTAGGRWIWLGGLQRRLQFNDVSAYPEGGFHAAKYTGGKAAFLTPFARMRLESAHHPLPGTAGSYQLRGMYAYAPETNQHAAPLFDTALREFSSGGIYDWNRFSGGDRAADASVAAYGVYFRRQDGKREQLSLELAQRYYFRRPRIALENETPPQRGFANLFAALRARPDHRWKIESNAEWNPADNTFESVYADVRADFGARRLLRIGGLFESDESLLLGGAFPLWRRADGGFNLRYLLGDDQITDSSVAVQIRSECDCWRLHFRINNVLTAENQNKKSYSIGLTLKGLGSTGGKGYEDIVADLR